MNPGTGGRAVHCVVCGHRKKYEALTNRYEAAKAELERLQNQRTLRSQQDKAMTLFINTLKKHPEVPDARDDTVWITLLDFYID